MIGDNACDDVRDDLLIKAITQLRRAQDPVSDPEYVLRLHAVSVSCLWEVDADLRHLMKRQCLNRDIASYLARKFPYELCKGRYQASLSPFLITQAVPKRIDWPEYIGNNGIARVSYDGYR